MSKGKKLFALFAILLGIAGVVACVSGIGVAWNVHSQLDETVASTFERVDTALARVQVLAEQTNDRVESVQAATKQLNDRVQQRVAELRDVPKEEAADIDEIERQLYVRIDHAKNLIVFMRASIDLVQNLKEMAQSASAFVQEDSRTTRELVASLRAGYDEIEEASMLAEDVRLAIIEIRESRNLEENAKKVNSLSSRIDASLAKVAKLGDRFESGIVDTRADAVDLDQRIRHRLLVIAILSTVFLVWMAIGQICLATLGRSAMRQS